jgi:phytoene synthase
VDLSTAYAHCEDVTRTRARNFSYGIRLLPADRRRALSAVYAFARRVDDIADGDEPDLAMGAATATPPTLEDRRAGLAACRAALKRLDDPDDPVQVALADAAERFPIPLDAFEDLVDGAEMDLTGTRYATFDDLVVYCRRVAGSIGRLSLGTFAGTQDASTRQLADDLGVALQVTNILRDVREDLADDRVYLPAEDLAAHDCDLEAGRIEGFPDLVHLEAGRARRWFDRGFLLLDRLDRRSGACVAAMAGIYRRLLERIDHEPLAVLERRCSLPAWEKGVVAIRSLTGARP